MCREPSISVRPVASLRSVARSSVLAAVLATLAGCATAPGPAAPAPSPPLTLLEAGALELPPDCEPVRGAVYRTEFVVAEDGAVSQAKPASRDGCVERALQRWVGTFRYQRIPEATTTVYDWMLVTATRGG